MLPAKKQRGFNGKSDDQGGPGSVENQPSQIVIVPHSVIAAGQGGESRGHRRNNVARIGNQHSADGVHGDCSRRKKRADHQIVGVISDLDRDVDQENIKTVVPQLSDSLAVGTPKHDLKLGENPEGEEDGDAVGHDRRA